MKQIDRLLSPAPPVHREKREQAVLDRVPLARSSRKMTHGDWTPDLVGQTLQLQLPQPRPVTIAPAAVSSHKQLTRLHKYLYGNGDPAKGKLSALFGARFEGDWFPAELDFWLAQSIIRTSR